MYVKLNSLKVEFCKLPDITKKAVLEVIHSKLHKGSLFICPENLRFGF